ncbi:MAG: hypothetical protein KDA96_23845 [Planctomycetaceae bacterium]|nr:hypothetical protein [Planctomycetaceae bacterium]MCA9066130.1 hypothetical protein [Planctomycetaceae bacterium]
MKSITFCPDHSLFARSSFRRFLLGVMALTGMMLPAVGQDTIDPARGMIYFIGMVTQADGATVQVDLGVAHHLRPQDRVAVFRSQDGIFAPLGLLEVSGCDSVSMHARKPVDFRPAFGDTVVYVRSLGDFGNADRHRDYVLETSLLAPAERRGYSTFGRRETAAALETIRRELPRWQRATTRIAGTVRGATAASRGEAASAGLLRQIDQYRRLEEFGVPILVAGPRWEAVMSVLRQPADLDLFAVSAAKEGITSEDASEFAEADQSSLPIGRTIRTLIQERMFDRSPEVQNLAAALSTMMILNAQRNEAAFLSREVRVSQFEWMVGDEQFVLDIRGVLQQYRDDLASQ